MKDGTRVTILPVAKLDYAEAQDDYVALSSEGKQHLKQQTISSLESIARPHAVLADSPLLHRESREGRAH